MTFDPHAAAKALKGNATQRKILATCLGRRQTDCSPSIEIKTVASLRIVIQPTGSGLKWTARLDDRVLCASAWPFVNSARLLLAEGHASDTMIEMWRPNIAEWAMRGRLGAVAATIIEGEVGSRVAKNGPPVHDFGPAKGKQLPLDCARARAVSRVHDLAFERSRHSLRRRRNESPKPRRR
jgi:hypothetical protein